jgi:hypothetical protein
MFDFLNLFENLKVDVVECSLCCYQRLQRSDPLHDRTLGLAYHGSVAVNSKPLAEGNVRERKGTV